MHPAHVGAGWMPGPPQVVAVHPDMESRRVRELVRACGFAVATAEFALAGRLKPEIALEAIASEIDEAMRELGCDLRDLARAQCAFGDDAWRQLADGWTCVGERLFDMIE